MCLVNRESGLDWANVAFMHQCLYGLQREFVVFGNICIPYISSFPVLTIRDMPTSDIWVGFNVVYTVNRVCGLGLILHKGSVMRCVTFSQ